MKTSPTLAASLAAALLLSVTACGGPEDSPEGEAPAPTADDEQNSEPEQDPEEAQNQDEGESAQTEEPESQERETEEPEPEPELPGGGDTVFPDRRLVAAYGSPGAPELGILGEGDLDAALAQVQQYADDYQELSEEPVIPAFEIITTVASAHPGPQGTYTIDIDPDIIDPWVEAAEVNDVARWLAELTEEHELPQKVLMLHQFKHLMITNREDIDTSFEELAFVLHVDGHGPPEVKLDSWNTLREDLAEDFWLGWKNLHDEDSPTFTPEETYDLDPQPWFVSYQ